MRRISTRSQLLGLPVLFFLLTPLWLPPLSSFLTPPALEKATEKTAAARANGFLMEGLTFSQTNNEQEEIHLTARQAFSENSDQQILLIGVTANLSDENGRELAVSSDEATYYPPEKQIILKKAVEIATDDFIGRTELLNYFPEVRIAETTEDVDFSGAEMKIRGTGFSYDLGSGELVVGGSGRVSCSID
jgi:LPS export ABC transporter protein LptC